MIVIIDNYDSFTYNLFQYVKEFFSDVLVLKNDSQKIDSLKINRVKAFVFSPGPGRPSKGGKMPELIKNYHTSIPMLGICLGHQSIVESFGGEIVHASQVCHGKVNIVNHFSNSIIFSDIHKNFQATRYHSLVVSKEKIPSCLEITAISQIDHEIMAIQHKKYRIFGLQFHPESIETKDGMKMIKNFIDVI